jgi:glycerophosphoryl diester phosphodiesterase
VIGHRGAATLAPENTLEGIEAAISAGADGFECDVRMTKDGTLVLMHDAEVDRTTEGAGRVVDLTLAEIRGLDAAYRFGDGERLLWSGRGLRVPTVEEALRRAAGRCLAILELKGHPFEPGYDPAEPAVGALLALLEARPAEGLVVSSSNLVALERLRRARPDVPTAVLTGPGLDAGSAVRAALDGLHPAWHAPDARADGAAIDLAHSAGLEVVVWTVNDGTRMRELAALGADGIITDDPATAAAALHEHGQG